MSIAALIRKGEVGPYKKPPLTCNSLGGCQTAWRPDDITKLYGEIMGKASSRLEHICLRREGAEP